jgi:5-(hydroxymethyl)furfural/furfural oxidase
LPCPQRLPDRALAGTEEAPPEAVTGDRALDDWLLATVFDCFHPVGTCRIGAADDPRSVVDADCRVIGLDGLRVVDAAIMPDVPRANTNLTCIMIGEHVAARLRR